MTLLDRTEFLYSMDSIVSYFSLTLYILPRHFFFLSFFLFESCSLLPCLSTTCSSSPLSDSLSLFCRDLPEKERTLLSPGLLFHGRSCLVLLETSKRNEEKKKKNSFFVCVCFDCGVNLFGGRTKNQCDYTRHLKRVHVFQTCFILSSEQVIEKTKTRKKTRELELFPMKRTITGDKQKKMETIACVWQDLRPFVFTNQRKVRTKEHESSLNLEKIFNRNMETSEKSRCSPRKIAKQPKLAKQDMTVM